ncbi:MAG: YciI family protein [Sterolibacterium sp.]|jgi:hypothetical protein
MLFAVRFFDRADRYEVRQQHLQAHIEWLDQRKDRVLVAGSLRNELGTQPIGGLWIVDAENPTEIEQLIESDPFWANGLRQSYEIHHWSKAFPERMVPV